MIAGLDHINIRTADLAGTKALFVDVLGLSDGWRPDVPVPGAWLYWEGRAMVHLVEVAEPAIPSDGAALDHVAFSIADYEATRAQLQDKGIGYSERGLPGFRQLNVKDVSGVTVELNWRDPAAA